MRGGLAERSPPPGRPPLTALVVLGVRGRRREPGRRSPNFGRPACSFAFGFSGSSGSWTWVGFREGGQGARAWPRGPSFRLRAAAGPQPRGVPALRPCHPRARASVWDSPPRAGCRPRGPRSLRGAVGSSGAAEPRGGDCARIRTRRRGAPPSPISRPGTVAGAPGGPIGVSTPKQMDPGFTRWV